MKSMGREDRKRKHPGNTFESENNTKNKKLAAPHLGIIRLDYDCLPAQGNIDFPDSFDSNVYYKVVPGLTFQK